MSETLSTYSGVFVFLICIITVYDVYLCARVHMCVVHVCVCVRIAPMLCVMLRAPPETHCATPG